MPAGTPGPWHVPIQLPGVQTTGRVLSISAGGRLWWVISILAPLTADVVADKRPLPCQQMAEMVCFARVCPRPWPADMLHGSQLELLRLPGHFLGWYSDAAKVLNPYGPTPIPPFITAYTA